ncbi:hypothetical protein [Actinoallomurus sp. CA-150999]|uniref:hypothetical protein n=1 Tax=Actinoallomurus sp. CA-150999 TaxID=3239887 RepID=UPI003D94C92B
MNQFEMRRAEQDIRNTLTDTGLEWVLDEVDAAIAAGVPEERILRRQTQRGGPHRQPMSPRAAAAEYVTLDREQLSGDEYESSRKRGTLVITTRAMTDQERLELLLDALRRVLIEVPDIEGEITKTLATPPDTDEGMRVEVEDTSFEPDESARRRESLAIKNDRVPQESRNRIRGLLADAIREVRG